MFSQKTKKETIREKFPNKEKLSPIYTKEDNATPHLAVDDSSITKECLKYGWNLELQCQRPNSPDVNVLDLGFFLKNNTGIFKIRCLQRILTT